MDKKLFRRYCKLKANNPDFYEYVDISYMNTPITVLLGPNGSGKSMSLLRIKEYCNSKDIPCSTYSNKRNDIVNTAMDFDPQKIIYAMYSEGERIKGSLINWDETEFLYHLLSHDKDVYFLMDELDSGLSIDKLTSNIKDYLSVLSLEKEKHPNRTVKLIFTCNSYEMLELLKDDPRTKLIWVPTKEEIKINSYEEFKKLYLDYLNIYDREVMKALSKKVKEDKKVYYENRHE